MSFNIQAAIDAAFAQSSAQISALTQQVVALQAAVATKDAEIAALKTEITALKARIAELEAATPEPQPEPEPEPEPAPTPVPTPPPASAWPDATNTGVPAGTVLTPSGSIRSSAAGQIIEGKHVTGYIEVRHANVIVRKCKVTPVTDFYGIFTSGSGTGVTIEDCEVDMSAYKRGNKAIALERSGARIRRCNIHHCEDGIYMSARDVVIEDNWFHDFAVLEGDPHHDGIQLTADQCSEVVIRRNAVMLTYLASSCFTTGAVQNLTIENNRMHGGAATLRIRGENGSTVTSGVKILNNRFANWWVKGFPLDLVNAGTIVVSGNVNDLTGAPIS